jgi:hypothetical protein
MKVNTMGLITYSCGCRFEYSEPHIAYDVTYEDWHYPRELNSDGTAVPGCKKTMGATWCEACVQKFGSEMDQFKAAKIEQ